jgi:hypothetical protein
MALLSVGMELFTLNIRAKMLKGDEMTHIGNDDPLEIAQTPPPNRVPPLLLLWPLRPLS